MKYKYSRREDVESKRMEKGKSKGISREEEEAEEERRNNLLLATKAGRHVTMQSDLVRKFCRHTGDLNATLKEIKELSLNFSMSKYHISDISIDVGKFIAQSLKDVHIVHFTISNGEIKWVLMALDVLSKCDYLVVNIKNMADPQLELLDHFPKTAIEIRVGTAEALFETCVRSLCHKTKIDVLRLDGIDFEHRANGMRGAILQFLPRLEIRELQVSHTKDTERFLLELIDVLPTLPSLDTFKIMMTKMHPPSVRFGDSLCQKLSDTKFKGHLQIVSTGDLYRQLTSLLKRTGNLRKLTMHGIFPANYIPVVFDTLREASPHLKEIDIQGLYIYYNPQGVLEPLFEKFRRIKLYADLKNEDQQRFLTLFKNSATLISLLFHETQPSNPFCAETKRRETNLQNSRRLALVLLGVRKYRRSLLSRVQKEIVVEIAKTLCASFLDTTWDQK